MKGERTDKLVEKWDRLELRTISSSLNDALMFLDTALGYVPKRWLHMAGRTIYRVDTRKNHVEVRAWGIGESTQIVTKEVMRYDGVQVLPEWMQRKIAVLMTLDPSKVTDEIPNLGTHVAQGVFWVFAIDGETIGCDPGSEGQGGGS